MSSSVVLHISSGTCATVCGDQYYWPNRLFLKSCFLASRPLAIPQLVSRMIIGLWLLAAAFLSRGLSTLTSSRLGARTFHMVICLRDCEGLSEVIRSLVLKEISFDFIWVCGLSLGPFKCQLPQTLAINVLVDASNASQWNRKGHHFRLKEFLFTNNIN